MDHPRNLGEDTRFYDKLLFELKRASVHQNTHMMYWNGLLRVGSTNLSDGSKDGIYPEHLPSAQNEFLEFLVNLKFNWS